MRRADLARNAVTSIKVKHGALHAGDFRAGDLPKGADGADGAPGLGVAFARIVPGGVGSFTKPATVDSARSKNITQGQVTEEGLGIFCFNLDVPVKGISVTLESGNGSDNLRASLVDSIGCAGQESALVNMFDTGGPDNGIFYVVFY